MKEEKISGLYESFELKERKGLGGMKFKYASVNDIIDRMNRSFNGCWTTEVVSQERVEDFVVVRVRVSIFDADSERQFSHEGYGSSNVARFTSGNNAGQVIDLGNAYKSAEAKAIKNACTRWGVGLYLEEQPEEEAGPFQASVPSSETPVTKKEMPKNNPSPIQADHSFGGETQSTPITTKMPSMPPPVAASKKDELLKSKKAVQAQPSEPLNAVKTTEPTSIFQSPEENSITDVQKVAIKGLLQMRGFEFNKLASDALGRTTDLPKKPEDLSYQNAVTIIKYGNDINKK